MNNIDYEKSFYKTQNMLIESYKICDNLKKSNMIYKDAITKTINNVKPNNFSIYLSNIY